MDKTDGETHDFMNVDSFSQLPFIRPSPLKEKGSIRLFGKEFGGDSGVTDDSPSIETNTFDDFKDKHNDNLESSRKFECHYCCRNFPTSQALGGHQNAHKRERQQAKRAHLQASMVHGGFPDSTVFGFMNYRLPSAPTPPMAYHHHSWSNNNNNSTTYSSSTNNRFYGNGSQGLYSHHHHQQPINGSPLALWRSPTVQNSPNNFSRDLAVHPLPFYGKDELKVSSSIGSSSSQNRYAYELMPSVQDHVSLDLHL